MRDLRALSVGWWTGGHFLDVLGMRIPVDGSRAATSTPNVVSTPGTMDGTAEKPRRRKLEPIWPSLASLRLLSIKDGNTYRAVDDKALGKLQRALAGRQKRKHEVKTLVLAAGNVAQPQDVRALSEVGGDLTWIEKDGSRR